MGALGPDLAAGPARGSGRLAMDMEGESLVRHELNGGLSRALWLSGGVLL